MLSCLVRDCDASAWFERIVLTSGTEGHVYEARCVNGHTFYTRPEDLPRP